MNRYGIRLGIIALFGFLACGPAHAAPPDPTPSTAVVNVYVGGDRTTPNAIGPLTRVTFGLFGANPTNYDPFNGYTTDPPLYTCISQADGYCSFALPMGSGGVSPGSRLWVAPVAGPPGTGNQWYANPVWQTAPLVGGVRDQTRHVFQTPPLYPNLAFTSGSGGFISEPGQQTSPPNPTPEYTQRIDSGGVWPLSRSNPLMNQQCGVDVGLIVDLSSSMNGSVPALKTAMDAFVNALRGTPSRAALYTFSTDSPAIMVGANSQLLPVATTANANAFKAIYAPWTNATANGYTNWDSALAAVAAANKANTAANQFDIAVLLTDGNPTVYGPISGGIPYRSGYTRFREIGNAVASANWLKASGGIVSGNSLVGGTRVLAVGVGSGLDAGTDRNLRSISGRTAYTPSTPIDQVSYFRTNDYAVVGERLRELFLSACAPSVTVVKQIVPFGGTIDDAYTPAPGWDFEAETTTPGATVSPTSGSTDPITGALNFDLTFDIEDAPAGIDITEDLQPGYSPFPVSGDNAVCVNKSDDDNPVPVTNIGVDGFHLDLGPDDAVSCTVYNQAPDLDAASITVNKSWRLYTDVGVREYPNGLQPADLQSSMTLTGPAGNGASPQPWGVTRPGYEAGDGVTFEEDVVMGLPGCQYRGGTISGPGIDGVVDLDEEDPAAELDVGSGGNVYEVINDVRCVSHLTLLKEVQGGDADALSWNLHAIEPGGGNLPGPEGASGVSSEVSPSVHYQLAEQPNVDDPELLNYVQVDHRLRPLINPDSTGSMACILDDESAPTTTGDGSEGGIDIPRGHDVTCTAVNRTSFVRVIKQVNGGSADAASFRLRLEPVDPDPLGIPLRDIVGTVSPGATVMVRPEQRYRIRELSSNSNYDLTDLSCNLDGEPISTGNIVTPAGATVVCRATNTYVKPQPRARPRVTISKVANRRKAKRGQRITWRIAVRSVGNAAARNLRVCDRVPAPLILLRAPGGRIRAGRVCWRIQSLAPGRKRIFRVIVRVPRIGRGHRVANTAVVTGSNTSSARSTSRVRLVPDPPRPAFTG